MRNPDAPSGTFVHWLAWNLGPERRALPDSVPESSGTVMDGVRQGRNDFDEFGYDGPRPPPGERRRYVFRLFALDHMLTLNAGARRNDFYAALDGHVLGEAQLVGTYGGR